MATPRPTSIRSRRRSRIAAVGDAALGGDDDRGSLTLETVVLMPLVLLIIMLVVQAGLWMHATHVAQAAANKALVTASAHGSSAGQGRTAGEQSIDALGKKILLDPTVDVARTATTVTVAISATAPAVVPGLHWRVQATAVGPVERFVPDTEDAP
jgi:Flp pilus assembly protein TadG